MSKNPEAQALGRLGGLQRTKNLTKQQLRDAGRKAIMARWSKPKNGASLNQSSEKEHFPRVLYAYCVNAGTKKAYLYTTEKIEDFNRYDCSDGDLVAVYELKELKQLKKTVGLE